MFVNVDFRITCVRSGHYDPDAVRSCAQTVALHWQTLMLRIEDRLKLVNASAAFYRTSQQVFLSLDVSNRPTSSCPSAHLAAVSPGVWSAGESGAGVPPRGGLVRRWRQTA